MFKVARVMLVLLVPGVAAAQTITCEGMPGCLYLQAGDQPVTIVLQVMNKAVPVGRRPIQLISDQVSLASPLTTAADGRVSFVWDGKLAPGKSARIIAQLGPASADARTTIWIRTAKPPPPARRFLEVTSGSEEQTQFTGWELRTPLTLQLMTSLDPRTRKALPRALCEQSRVKFKALGPDDKLESVVTAQHDGIRCLATTPWVAGQHVGTQRVLASIEKAPEAHATFKINARKQARLVFGVSLGTGGRGFNKAVIDTVKFQIGQVGSTSDPRRDTVAVQRSTMREETDFSIEPMVGVDIPLGAFNSEFTNHVRFSVAVSPTDPDSRLFLGVSILQMALGLPMEGTGIDLHLGLQFSRLESTTADELCIDTEEHGAQCKLVVEKDSKWGYDGLTIMGVFDANSLVSSIISKLGGG